MEKDVEKERKYAYVVTAKGGIKCSYPKQFVITDKAKIIDDNVLTVCILELLEAGNAVKIKRIRLMDEDVVLQTPSGP